MSGPEPAFRRIAIAGIGLIGGSIALAVRHRWPSAHIVGVDTPSVLTHARTSGAIDEGLPAIAALSAADLVVLAAPVRQNARLLTELPASVLDAAIVTDVGGTKRDIVVASRRLPPGIRFIGGHPIGGAERGGFGFARRDLFQHRPWILTPLPDAAAADVGALRRFVEALGARPVMMEPAEHDRVMAFVSHLPQLAASALMDAVGAAVARDGLAVAGRGLVDTTRLAASPADVWRDICATNADVISAALDQLIDRLNDLRADLHRGEALEAVFAGAARWRAELLAQDRPRTAAAALMPRIFHITTRAAWDAAQAAGRYTADSLQTEGFIHCSQAEQVTWVANTRFRGRTDLVLLHVDEAAVGAEVRRENLEGGTTLFPHIYGPLPVSAVVKATPLVPSADGTFEIDLS
ncbi:MAG TPA: prephenate dehydrogenase/arogenate dehydrogenase family protein [Vicinamibacterales bacterium]|nr:prephenate dehydrogenase/arogenate dehydrogenase family protein [Vicinamibacterales bacterium]